MGQFHTRYLAGQISPEGEDLGVNIIAAMREAVGPNVGMLRDTLDYEDVPACALRCQGQVFGFCASASASASRWMRAISPGVSRWASQPVSADSA